MAGSMRKMGVYLGLVEDDDSLYADQESDRYDDYAGQDAPIRSTSGKRGERSEGGRQSTSTAVREVSLVEQHGALGEESFDQSYRISTLCPSTYNEALSIGQYFRDGSPVIMNLTEMDDSQAKRLVDFAAGLTFGLRGRLEKVTNKVFLLSPQNIDVTAEDKARIAEGTFYNQS